MNSITLRRTLDEHDTEGVLDHCAPSGAGGVQDGAVGRATLSPHDFVAQRRCAVVFLRTARNVVNSPPPHPVFEFFFFNCEFVKASSRRAHGGRGNRTQLIHIRGQDR